MSSSRASSSGWLGTLNGRRTMITFESASPGTSTPCQKLSAPKITLWTSALNASTIFDRGMPSLCENRAMLRAASQGINAAAACCIIRYDVNSTNALPSDLDPVAALGGLLLHPRRQGARQPVATLLRRGELDPLLLLLLELGPLPDRRRQLAQLLDHRVGPVERRAEPAVGPAVPLLP